MSKKKDSSVKKDLPNSKDSSVKKDRPISSPVYFYDEIPRIAACRSCTVLVPVPNISFRQNIFFKIRRSEQTLHSFGYCTILLLEYDSVEDVVNFTASENQTPTITLNLNRIIDKSLKHIVKDSKVWQEFHLNDSGKKRSFVLQFEKGQEFDEFFIKLSEVLGWLHACKKGKLSVDKKYYLVGFRDNPKEVITEIPFYGNSDPEERESFSSDSSENSTNDVIDSSLVLTSPFSPKPFNTLPTSRVTGLDEELSLGLLKRPESEEFKRGRYHKEIFGSMLQPVPASGISIFETHSKHSNDSDLDYSVNITELDLDKNGTVKHCDFCQSVNITEIDSHCDFCQTVNIAQLDFDNIKLKGETCDQAQIKHSDDSDLIHSVNITELDLDKNGTVKHRDFCQSVNITEIDSNCDFRKTVDIAQLDFDNIKGETDYQRDVLIGDEVVDTTMKARQEQNQLKQYAQLLQAAINDGDQENARQYADILAASHLKIAITVDENSLKVEANSQDIKIKVVIEDKECQGGSLLLSVKLTDTIGDLKAKMFFKHKFPIEVQKWIVGKRIPKDEESLQRLRVTNDQTVYLYLVTAKSVGLDKQQHMATSGYIDMTVNDKGMPPMVPAVPHHVPQQPMNQLSSTPTKAPVRVDKPIQGAPVEPPPRGAVFNPVTQAEHEVPIEKPPKRPEPGSSQIANIKGQDADSKQQIGWHCLACTFLNLPTRPGCEMCSHPRPKDYKIPENYKMSKEEVERIKREEDDERKAQQLEKERQRREAEQSQQNFQQLLQTDDQHLVPNRENFDCPICFDRINPGRGVVLRECLHSFCRDCLKGAIVHNEEAFLRCPYYDGSYSCYASLQDREIKALVPDEIYERYLQKSLATAESQEMNSFHCKTPDCQGWCIYEDHVNFFKCPVCNKENCLTCKAIHEGVNCKKYQDDLQAQANDNAAARRTRQMLNDMVKKGEAMHCPQCKVILQKKDGCDWLKCSICKTEICWVTKGPRWGPNGPGDISGGCHCRVNGVACHPECSNCH